ncbi:hypothetical protein [Sphingobium mellinum]|uniref:hypothetical protein n=1 Tax=Sphingobium mellinum TaxID=1387166 RepID=UPI0030ECA2F1
METSHVCVVDSDGRKTAAQSSKAEAGALGRYGPIKRAVIETGQPGAIATKMAREFGAQLADQLALLDDAKRENYGQYFAQQKTIGKTTDIIVLSRDQVAQSIIDVLEVATSDARYPIGGAIKLFEGRNGSTDREMDEMMNQLLPGRRADRSD